MRWKFNILFLIIFLTFSIFVYATAPSVTVTSPSNNSLQKLNVSVVLNTSISSNLTVNITDSSNNVVSQLFSNDNTDHNVTWVTNNGSFSDGVYNITFYAINSTNTSEETTLVNAISNITIDNTEPSIENVTTTTAQTTTLINWDLNELANASVAYGTSISNLGSSSVNTSLSTNFSINLIGLSSSTQYFYNITSCDEATNCNTSGPFNFTTNQNPDTTNSPGSSGGISTVDSSGEESVTILSPFNSVKRVFVGEGSTLKLILPNDLGKHTLTLEKINSNSAKFVIESTPKNIIAEVWEEYKVDLNDNGYYDLSLIASSIDNDEVGIKITLLDDTIPVLYETENTPIEIVDTIQENSKIRESPEEIQENFSEEGNSYIYWILLIVGLGIISTLFYLKKRKNF